MHQLRCIAESAFNDLDPARRLECTSKLTSAAAKKQGDQHACTSEGSAGDGPIEGSAVNALQTAIVPRGVARLQIIREPGDSDCTEAGITWFLAREAERAQVSTPPVLALGTVMGPAFGQATVNLRRNLSEGRAALIQAICEKI